MLEEVRHVADRAEVIESKKAKKILDVLRIERHIRPSPILLRVTLNRDNLELIFGLMINANLESVDVNTRRPRARSVADLDCGTAYILGVSIHLQ